MAQRTTQNLRTDALAIWNAAVAAVDSGRLVRQHLQVQGNRLSVGEEELNLADFDRIAVVGAGKAGAGMAEGLEAALGSKLLRDKKATGWLNVPADCVRQLEFVRLHAGRPAGVNEPTQAGVDGSNRILEILQSLTPRDLCFCLISGGGSALMPAPIEGISLGDKQAITKHLSAAGANIQELNTVRKQLSRLKGGGLARACRARLVTLIISDVLGDPLDVIASGPTVKNTTSPRDALHVLEKYVAEAAGVALHVFRLLEQRSQQRDGDAPTSSRVTNLIIGNNATAVDAAGQEAERRGYAHAMVAANQLEGHAEEIGRHHARMAIQMRRETGPDCLITGGEPTVQLAPPEKRGKGGRNQQLVLAALDELVRTKADSSNANPLDGTVLLSGGTDGEDGPTDAAGALIDADIWHAANQRSLDARNYLLRNDAYPFFETVGGLIKTGPTHTNVCDVRVVLVNRS